MSLVADQLSIPHDEAAARHGRDRPSRYLQTFIWRVVGALMKVGLRQDSGSLRVPYRDVGIVTYRYRAFSGQSISLGVIGCRQRHELIEGDASLADPFRKQDWKAGLDSGNAVRNPAKAGSRVWRQLARRVVVAKRA